MRSLAIGYSRVALVAVLGAVVFTVSQTASVHGQNSTQSTQCQPFQKSADIELTPSSPGNREFRFTIRVPAGRTLVLEQIALLIDPYTFVYPTVASVWTTIGRDTSAYYVPIPTDAATVSQYHPLTLMQPVRLYADGGSVLTLLILVDARNVSSGRAQWSISGLSCAAI